WYFRAAPAAHRASHMETSARRSRTLKRRRWGGLRQQWQLLGLFQIDEQHEFYHLTCMMKEGLSAAIQRTSDPVPTVSTDFTMETFAGPVFASLRGSLGLTEQEYQQSLCSEHFYLQFISNSKSRADFFLTNDKRFFLKTQNRREIKFLLSNLKIYVEHLKKFPHSLLVKFLGVHRITFPRRQKKFFIVMQSVFYPDERINARYDIKGCEVSRWTDPALEESHIIVVLKDLNFEGQFITLDQQRSWLLRQVEIDTQFLRRLNVLDYSLLLAHQPLHWDERHHSFANIIIRTKRSAQNRRLLPNLKNPLHVIDGPEQRYFIGIIDIFTVYSFKKRLEHWWKSLRHPGKSFSTVSPDTYCHRLQRWVQDHTK
uniref:PIPK domain-containing protein n=1 Tax=Periophthalmus magnuspinnatus TaxID=409849 RepID=A0A3B3ZH43_9GOBI